MKPPTKSFMPEGHLRTSGRALLQILKWGKTTPWTYFVCGLEEERTFGQIEVVGRRRASAEEEEVPNREEITQQSHFHNYNSHGGGDGDTLLLLLLLHDPSSPLCGGAACCDYSRSEKRILRSGLTFKAKVSNQTNE